MKIEHLNYTVGTDKIILPFPWRKVYWFYIHNTSSNNLFISFDQGETWKKIGPDDFLDVKGFSNEPILIEKDSIRVYGSASDTTMEILVLVNHNA